jgi:hypothetical protein
MLTVYLFTGHYSQSLSAPNETTIHRNTHTKRDVAAASYLYMYMYYCADAMEIINRVSVLLATVLYKCLTARGFCAGLSCLDFQGPWASESV